MLSHKSISSRKAALAQVGVLTGVWARRRPLLKAW